MNAKLFRRLTVAGVAALSAVGLVCCSRTISPGVEPAPPRVVEEAPEESDRSAVKPKDPTTEKPQTPPYLAVVERIQSDGEARISATIDKPRKLVLDTDNVKRIQITREGLPFPRDRSIVLRVDGQGIEWTRQYFTVVLERSSTGVWEVVRGESAKP